MRIVRVANFVTATSGGLRTALHRLGAGYVAAGHDPVLIVPGAATGDGRHGVRPRHLPSRAGGAGSRRLPGAA